MRRDDPGRGLGGRLRGRVAQRRAAGGGACGHRARVLSDRHGRVQLSREFRQVPANHDLRILLAPMSGANPIVPEYTIGFIRPHESSTAAPWCSGQAFGSLEPATAVRICPGLSDEGAGAHHPDVRRPGGRGGRRGVRLPRPRRVLPHDATWPNDCGGRERGERAEPVAHARRLPRLHQRRGTDGPGGTPSRTRAATPRLKASISRRFIVVWPTAHRSSSGVTTSASSPGRSSGSASRTNFAKTFLPSRTNGTASGSTTIRRAGESKTSCSRRAPAALSVKRPSSARSERTWSPSTRTLRTFPVFFETT